MKNWKIGGKKKALPQVGASSWKFAERPGGWILAENTETGERRRLMLSQVKGKLSASLAGKLYFGELAEARESSSAGGSGGDSDLTAQFPGKVRKLLVASGAVVKEGDSLLLMEAMKMEFAIKAPFAGTVKRILVQESQQVSPGDRYVDLEPVKDSKADSHG